MTSYYGRSVYRYFSRLNEKQSFDTADEARAYDVQTAARAIAIITRDAIDTALRNGSGDLVAALRFLADEIEDAGRAPRAAAIDSEERA